MHVRAVVKPGQDLNPGVPHSRLLDLKITESLPLIKKPTIVASRLASHHAVTVGLFYLGQHYVVTPSLTAYLSDSKYTTATLFLTLPTRMIFQEWTPPS